MSGGVDSSTVAIFCEKTRIQYFWCDYENF